ncbi:MAG: superinfection immunity protein [Candidatus Nitrotoga sp.]
MVLQDVGQLNKPLSKTEYQQLLGLNQINRNDSSATSVIERPRMDGLLLAGLILILLFIYFIPAYLAYWSDHPQRHWIFVCNLFAGATIIVWIICMIWVLTYDDSKDSEAQT